MWCCFSLGDAHGLHCEPPHTPVARAAFENSCIEFIFAQCCLSKCLKITPLSQDKVCFYLDLAFCVIQSESVFAAFQFRREATQCWDLCQSASEEMSSRVIKDASAKPGAVWKSSEGDTAPSATKQDFKSHIIESSTGSSANCQTVEGSSSKFRAQDLFGSVLCMFVNLKAISFLSLNGLCAVFK